MTGAGIIIAAAGQSVRRKHVCRDYVTCLDAQTQRPSTCRVKRANARRERYRLPNSEQLFLFVAADDELMKDENVIDFRLPNSYSYSSSLMMTPASSSTVAVFHRRVGRYRLPMTRYLARRAVRRRSSSAVAWRHPSVSVGAPYRSFQFGQNWGELNRNEQDTTVNHHLVAVIRRPASQRWSPRTAMNWTETNWTPPYSLHLVVVIRRPAFQRWSPRTDAVTRRREPLSNVGSDRCLHLGDNRTVLPSPPQAACPVLSELFWHARLTDVSYLRHSRSKRPCELTIQSNYIELLHFFLLLFTA